MKHTLRITILVVLFCAAAVQSWANFPNATITKGYIYGGTVKIYAQVPTTNTSQSEIADAAAGNTVYLVAEADYQHTSVGIDWRVMKSGSSSVAQSRTRSVDYAAEITVTNVAGNVYSFTMPTGGESVTVSATFAGKPTAQTTYIDPTKPAGQQECSATAYILDGTEQSIGADGKTTWYVCNSDVTYESSIKIHGPIHLILADGKTMSVGISNADNGIDGGSGSSLTVYGQSLGTGQLNATAKSEAIAIYDNFTLNGGQVTAKGTFGLNIGRDITINGGFMMTEGSDVSIDCVGDFTFNGGQFAARSPSGTGIVSSNGNIVLGWSDPDDYIYAKSFSCGNGKLSTTEGKRFVAYKTEKNPDDESFDHNVTTNEATAIVSGTAGTDGYMLDDIAGKTLRPIAVAEPDGQGGTTVSPGYLLSIVPGDMAPADKTDSQGQPAPDFTITTGTGDSQVTTPYYIYKAGSEGTTIPLSVPDYGQQGADFTVSIDGAAASALPDAAVTIASGKATAALPWTGAHDVEIRLARYYNTGVKYLEWDVMEEKLVQKTTSTDADNLTKVYILTGEENDELPGGWYVVKNLNTDVSNNGGIDAQYSCRLYFTGDTHLIITDGAKMQFGTLVRPIADNSIYVFSGSLAIHAQTAGASAGTLNVFTYNRYYGISSYSSNTDASVTLNGVNVTCYANESKGISAQSFYGNASITINGGIVDLTENRDFSGAGPFEPTDNSPFTAIYAVSKANCNVTIRDACVSLYGSLGSIEVYSPFIGTSTLDIQGGQIHDYSEKGIKLVNSYGKCHVILGWKNLSDYIYSPKYDVEGDISIASGQYLLAADKIHGSGKAFSGTLDADDIAAIQGKYLQPAKYTVSAPDNVSLAVTDGTDAVEPVIIGTGDDATPYYIYKEGLTVSASLTNEAMQADFAFKNKQGDDLQGDFTTRDLQGTTATVTIDGSSPAASITEVIAVSFTLPDDDVVIATSNVGVLSGGSQYLAFVDNGGNIKTTDGNVVILVFKGLQNNPTTGAIEAIFEEVDEVPEDLPVIFANKTDGSSLPATIPVAEDNSDAANTLAKNIRSNASPFFMTGAAGNLLKDILKAALTDADGNPLTNGSGYTLSQEFSDYVYFVFTGDKFVAASASAASTLSARRYILAIDKVTLLKLLNGSGSPAPARVASSTSRVWTFPVMVGGNSNGITNLTIDTDSPDNGNWYSIDGRRLNTAPRTKGVYIHKDKVVVVKY